MIAGGVMSGIGSLFKMGTSISQMIKGKKLQKELDRKGRPVMTTPEAFSEKEGLVRSKYLDPRFAGQATMEDRAQSVNANQLKTIQDTAGSGASALTAVLAGQNNLNNNLTDIGVEGAQLKQQDLATLMNVLGDKANLQQQQWDYNVNQPYKEKAAQARALREAGQTNFANSMSDSANLAIGLGQNAQQQKNFDASRSSGIVPQQQVAPSNGMAVPNMGKTWMTDPNMIDLLKKKLNPSLFYTPQAQLLGG